MAKRLPPPVPPSPGAEKPKLVVEQDKSGLRRGARVTVFLSFQVGTNTDVARRKKPMSYRAGDSMSIVYESVAGKTGSPPLWPKDFTVKVDNGVAACFYHKADNRPDNDWQILLPSTKLRELVTPLTPEERAEQAAAGEDAPQVIRSLELLLRIDVTADRKMELYCLQEKPLAAKEPVLVERGTFLHIKVKGDDDEAADPNQPGSPRALSDPGTIGSRAASEAAFEGGESNNRKQLRQEYIDSVLAPVLGEAGSAACSGRSTPRRAVARGPGSLGTCSVRQASCEVMSTDAALISSAIDAGTQLELAGARELEDYNRGRVLNESRGLPMPSLQPAPLHSYTQQGMMRPTLQMPRFAPPPAPGSAEQGRGNGLWQQEDRNELGGYEDALIDAVRRADIAALQSLLGADAGGPGTAGRPSLLFFVVARAVCADLLKIVLNSVEHTGNPVMHCWAVTTAAQQHADLARSLRQELSKSPRAAAFEQIRQAVDMALHPELQLRLQAEADHACGSFRQNLSQEVTALEASLQQLKALRLNESSPGAMAAERADWQRRLAELRQQLAMASHGLAGDLGATVAGLAERASWTLRAEGYGQVLDHLAEDACRNLEKRTDDGLADDLVARGPDVLQGLGDLPPDVEKAAHNLLLQGEDEFSPSTGAGVDLDAGDLPGDSGSRPAEPLRVNTMWQLEAQDGFHSGWCPERQNRQHLHLPSAVADAWRSHPRQGGPAPGNDEQMGFPGQELAGAIDQRLPQRGNHMGGLQPGGRQAAAHWQQRGGGRPLFSQEEAPPPRGGGLSGYNMYNDNEQGFDMMPSNGHYRAPQQQSDAFGGVRNNLRHGGAGAGYHNDYGDAPWTHGRGSSNMNNLPEPWWQQQPPGQGMGGYDDYGWSNQPIMPSSSSRAFQPRHPPGAMHRSPPPQYLAYDSGGGFGGACQGASTLALDRGPVDGDELVQHVVSDGENADADTTNQDALFDAVTAGDYSAVQSVLDSKVDVNKKTNRGSHILFRAVSKATCTDIINLLISRQANVAARGTQGDAIMHFWARATVGRQALCEIGQCLLQAKASARAQRDTDGMSPLHHVAIGHNNRRGWLDFHKAVFLLKNGAQVNAQTDKGQRPWHLVIKDGRQSTKRMLSLLQDGLSHDESLHRCGNQDCVWCNYQPPIWSIG
eukprot:TRINITY_DN13476_c0_g1_i1.p1 TRINITY_DN13476_c0_g1~~TRINITY_DN13476_c0_g1_i1.p1  ORF type:complete len:1160 (+),score=199.75 TRINITY_DN13476_c0_g1_i1:183-3662(+)